MVPALLKTGTKTEPKSSREQAAAFQECSFSLGGKVTRPEMEDGGSHYYHTL